MPKYTPLYAPSGTTMKQRLRQRSESSERFREPPVDISKAPFHLDFGAIAGTDPQSITNAGQIVFHVVGDTGDVNGTGAQEDVAIQMARQIWEAPAGEEPAFLYHLGDVIYYNGELANYYEQFYYPYIDYPAPIVAIPGNHDGETLDPADTLRPFMSQFCSTGQTHPTEAQDATRFTMIQPNCYWRLDAPFVTIIGLYSNLTGELDNSDAGKSAQVDWLTEELRTSPADTWLLLAVHHPLYSLAKHGGAPRVLRAIKEAISNTGRLPDVILTGHDHCYQRFSVKWLGQRVPVLVVGAGGFAGYDNITTVDESLGLPKKVKLKAFNDRRPGFLRMTLSETCLRGEYFTVRGPGKEHRGPKLRDAFCVEAKRR